MEENKMGVMPIKKLVITMSLPMMISMLVQALYNVVDSLFVARVSEDALTAVSLAFSVQNLMISFISGTCVGINALLSRYLGAKNHEGANRVAVNGLFVVVITYIFFLLFGLFGTRAFFHMLTKDKGVVDAGVEYLSIISIASIGMTLQMTLERLLQSTGKTFYTMITQGLGAIINIILDPIFIFGYLGMPAMGVAGAAVATIFGQIIAAGLALYFNLKKNDEIKLSFKGFRPQGNVIGKIYQVAIPSIIMMSVGSILNFFMNKILLIFTKTATTVFGVYFKVQSFFFMPVFGLNNGMVPIVAYNYGARNPKRIKETVKFSVILAVAIMLFGLAVMQFFPREILLMFNASEDMMIIGISALRIISLSFLFAGFCIIAGSVFQALGNGVYSLIVSIARQLVVLLPAAYLLAKVFGDPSNPYSVNAVWWSFPIAEIMSVIVSAILLIRIFNKKIRSLNDDVVDNI